MNISIKKLLVALVHAVGRRGHPVVVEEHGAAVVRGHKLTGLVLAILHPQANLPRPGGPKAIKSSSNYNLISLISSPVRYVASLYAPLLALLIPPPADLRHLLLSLLPTLLLRLHGLHRWLTLALTRLTLWHLTTAPEYKSVPARSEMCALIKEC